MVNVASEKQYILSEIAALRDRELMADLNENTMPDGRPVWTDEDLRLLSTAEDLEFMIEHEGEFIAEMGSDYFYGDGPECRNGSVAISVARSAYNDHFRRIHNGLSKDDIERLYWSRYGSSVKPKRQPKPKVNDSEIPF